MCPASNAQTPPLQASDNAGTRRLSYAFRMSPAIVSPRSKFPLLGTQNTRDSPMVRQGSRAGLS